MRSILFVPCVLIALSVLAATVAPVRHMIKGNVLGLYDLSLYNRPNSELTPPVEQHLVAHAGGAFNGESYTNSREALDHSYASGYRVFELDFDWTSDGHLVLVHDWDHTSSLFTVAPHVFSYQEFISRHRTDGLHQLAIEDLRQWLHAHSDAFIVTDTKSPNPRLLNYLAQNGRDILPQLILQIYRLSELQSARSLAPRAVWLTIYKCNYPAWALARITGVDAFVIPVERYGSYSRPKLLQQRHFYVHSISADQIDQTFQHLPGIYGIYVN
ncbi:MAG TPA: glycerophosphodiester phosphodiesterase family protein [Acidobacteriaceae bacterium]|nr:glycerophosphodiester phosphodiesterase family protein [Acidobacteriaceae bacterium]